ncbi:MAG: helix-turn-helix transcriptional regulator [Beijerinckiaceae bacterium]
MAASVLKWFNKAEVPVEGKEALPVTNAPGEVPAAPVVERARFLRPSVNEQAIEDLRSLLAISTGAGAEVPSPVPLPKQANRGAALPQGAPPAISPEYATRERAPVVGASALSTPQALGQRIRARRRELDLTQAELAALAGVGKRFMVEVEQGKITLELGKVMQVVAACGLTLSIS